MAITHVFETHIHNDYVTGGLALARADRRRLPRERGRPVAFDRTRSRTGTRSRPARCGCGSSPRPGTPSTTCPMRCRARRAGRRRLHRRFAAERLDRAHRPARRGAPGELARAQHGSARRLAAELPDTRWSARPTVSAASARRLQPRARPRPSRMRSAANPALTLDEAEYVESLLAGLDAYPAYYAHMAPANSAGPAAARPRRRGAPIRPSCAAGSTPGSGSSTCVPAPRSRPGTCAARCTSNSAITSSTYLGWLIPWGTPLTLLGETPADVVAAQRELARIGIDRPAAAAVGRPEDWAGGEPLRGYPVLNFAAFGRALGRAPAVLLDVRRHSEWQVLADRGRAAHPAARAARPARRDSRRPDLGALPGGYRASVAASLAGCRRPGRRADRRRFRLRGALRAGQRPGRCHSLTLVAGITRRRAAFMLTGP